MKAVIVCCFFIRAICAAVIILNGAETLAQNLFVGEPSSGNIIEITPSGVQSTVASVGANTMEGLTVDSAGDAYVSQQHNINNIIEITPGGSQNTIASGLYFASLTYDNTGNLFVATEPFPAGFSSSIIKIARDGSQSTFAFAYGAYTGSYGPAPQQLAFDNAGNLFETDLWGYIYKFTPNGVQSTFASVGSGPDGLAIDKSGNLFVATYQNGQIIKITPDGQQTIFASGLNSPDGLAFDNAGNLYEADASGNIFEFAPDGTQTTFASGLSDAAYLAFQPVPEPSSLGLATFALIVFLARNTHFNIFKKKLS